MDDILERLVKFKTTLIEPFPYKDTKQMQIDFEEEFSKLPDEINDFSGDFNTYCMNIAGTLSYILNGKTTDIPPKQIELLNFSFFEWFKQYGFVEVNLSRYEEFHREYMNFEEARKLLLEYLG